MNIEVVDMVEKYGPLVRKDFGVVNTIENGDEEGHKVVIIDTARASYRGRKWTKLNRFERRKFENLVVLSEPTERIRVFYQTPDGMGYDREAAARMI